MLLFRAQSDNLSDRPTIDKFIHLENDDIESVQLVGRAQK